MNFSCPSSQCKNPTVHPGAGRVIRHGSFIRRSDGACLQRWLCLDCGRTFSEATYDSCFGQNKRHLNPSLSLLLCSGASLRRLSRILNLHRTTVGRKLEFLAKEARLRHSFFLKQTGLLFDQLQFDELETFEHSKCKPLSVPLMVDEVTRKILGFEVSQRPAKGHLSKIAQKKYGYRKDERRSALSRLMESVKPLIDLKNTLTLKSDECPRYPGIVKMHFPKAVHKTYKGRRGCIVGQGELKKIGFDPIFSLNHTCAMLRANINRLFRKTWCTTKKRSRLIDHISLYVSYHNEVLTPHLAPAH